MKSSLFWEGPIVSILYVLQTRVSENTELIAEAVAENAEGFVPQCLPTSSSLLPFRNDSRSTDVYPGGVSSSLILPRDISHFSTNPQRRISKSKCKYWTLRTFHFLK